MLAILFALLKKFPESVFRYIHCKLIIMHKKMKEIIRDKNLPVKRI